MISGIYQVNVKYQSNHSFMLYQHLQTEYIFDTFTEGNENNFQNE